MNYIVNYIALQISIFARTRKRDLSHSLHGTPAIHSNVAGKIYASNTDIHAGAVLANMSTYMCTVKAYVALVSAR